MWSARQSAQKAHRSFERENLHICSRTGNGFGSIISFLIFTRLLGNWLYEKDTKGTNTCCSEDSCQALSTEWELTLAQLLPWTRPCSQHFLCWSSSSHMTQQGGHFVILISQVKKWSHTKATSTAQGLTSRDWLWTQDILTPSYDLTPALYAIDLKQSFFNSS